MWVEDIYGGEGRRGKVSEFANMVEFIGGKSLRSLMAGTNCNFVKKEYFYTYKLQSVLGF